jgi:processive 1,2-diacylglycerol beta-glucosyltransferase
MSEHDIPFETAACYSASTKPRMIQHSTVIVAIVLVTVLATARYVSLSKRPRLEDPLEAENGPPSGPLRVLVLTAAVGGGHEAAGQSVGAELKEAGHNVVVKDGLRAMGRALEWVLVRVYLGQARNTPGSIGIVYEITSGRGRAAVVRAIVGLLFAGRLLKAIREERPDLVVSTYPLVIAALGHLRKSGKLGVPAAAIISDYGAHPLWVASGVDLHLVVSPPSAELISHAGGKGCVARLPVAPKFGFAPTREVAREILGLPQETLVALIVGGAWGIGDLGGAARRVAESGAYAIIVTGNNVRLKNRLEEEFGSNENVRVLGWREDVPVLMAASDCLIQNAGGMTCLEAVEMGLPILIFEPLKGHGELNARIMEQAGDAHLVRTPEDLGALVRSLARREASLPTPIRDPGAPTASAVLESLAGSAPERLPRARDWSWPG